jgi:hypothetical protein
MQSTKLSGKATRVVTMPPDEQESRLNNHVAVLLPQEAHADLGLIDADDESVMWGGDDDAA